MNIFDGLYGYEKLMLVCGFVLFVFALAAIMVMIVQRRDFKAAMGLIVFAIVLMGFPGIQAVKFSNDMVELDRIRAQPQAPASPAQQQQAQQVLSGLEQRAADNPLLQAKVSDGYRAIGNVDKAYQLAQPLLRDQSAQVQATLVPVLTAKLNQVQADTRIAATPPPVADARPAAPPIGDTTLAGRERPVDGNGATQPPASATPTATAAQQRELATIASQLQATGAALPATSHVALAKAYVTLGRSKQAQANLEAARRIDPGIRISPTLSREANGPSPATEH